MTLRTRMNLLVAQFAAELYAEHQQPLIGPRHNIAVAIAVNYYERQSSRSNSRVT